MWVSHYRCYFLRVLILHSKPSRLESSLLQVRPPEHSIHLSPHSPALVNIVTSFPFNDSLPPPTQVVSFITAFLVFINLCIVSYRMLPTLYPIIRIFSDGEIAISRKSFLSSVMLFFLTSCGSQSRSANESVLLVLCRQNQNCCYLGANGPGVRYPAERPPTTVLIGTRGIGRLAICSLLAFSAAQNRVVHHWSYQ